MILIAPPLGATPWTFQIQASRKSKYNRLGNGIRVSHTVRENKSTGIINLNYIEHDQSEQEAPEPGQANGLERLADMHYASVKQKQ